MEYVIAGITFIFNLDPDGNVATVCSNNPVWVILVGQCVGLEGYAISDAIAAVLAILGL